MPTYNDGGQPFELDRLTTYDDPAIIAEMERVARLISGPLTRADFDAVGRVSTDTCARRFGGWRAALEKAGLGGRYQGPSSVSSKTRQQQARLLTDQAIIEEIQRVALQLGKPSVTQADVLQHSEVLGGRVIRTRLGSWQDALRMAGLEPSSRGRRWTADDYFENLLAVWTHYGRPPRYSEMDRPPSRITSAGYAKKFGSWGQAKQAFTERANADFPPATAGSATPLSAPSKSQDPQPMLSAPRDRRAIPLGLRYAVLRRDRFRCVTCGRNPAADPKCVLHVDHIMPFARGGKTDLQNLRCLCDKCNIGKGAGQA